MCSRRPSLLGFALALLLPLAAADEHPIVPDSECDCFLTNTSESYFTNHMFYDFRNLKQYAQVPDVINDFNMSANAPVTSEYFNSDAWATVWGIQNWNNTHNMGRNGNDATVRMVNSQNNVYIEQNTDSTPDSDTFLSFRTVRHEDFQSSAEMQSLSVGYHYVSVRMHARTIGDPGACTALFTYNDKAANVQEADIEMLTSGPDDKIQYTNQPSVDSAGNTIDQSTRNDTLPYGISWRQWAVHRLDWDAEQSTWLVDGTKMSSIQFQVPHDPSRIMVNSWSDGGSWSGAMDVGGQAVLQIQWIEMVFNTTDSPTTASKRSVVGSRRDVHGPGGKLTRRDGDGQCQVVCSIDSSDTIGKVVMLHNGTAPGLLLAESSTAAFWLPVLLMSAMLLHFMS